MSLDEHEWTRDQLAAHAADGLPADERARVERHLLECESCVMERNDLRMLDRSMEELFAPVRTDAALPDRMIRGLRERRSRTLHPALMAVAALLFVGCVGYALVAIDEGVGVGAEKPVSHMDAVRAKLLAQSGVDMARAKLPPTSTGGSIPAPVFYDAPLVSARDLDPNKKILDMEKSVEDPVYRKDAVESDHNETADEEEFQKAKGDSLDFVSDKPFQGKGTYDVIGGGGGRLNFKKTGERKSSGFYSYADGRSREKLAIIYDNKFFKPGEAKARLERDLSELEKESKSSVSHRRSTPDDGKKKLAAQAKADPAPQDPRPRRLIIRSGEIEFEIEAFDSTVARITQIAGEEGGFVATVNSRKLPNGKMQGTIVVRVPPDRLDTLILKLRALGELKSQRIGSQDVTKQYTDLQSRLRAARTMETRLLKIIEEGKGEIKDLLQAEKELGLWRTKLETLQGEIRYYDNLVALSTLTITLSEKELRSPFAITETERVDMGIEVEDVEEAQRKALAAVSEAKGRVTKSDLKLLAAGQFHATLQFEVPPDAAGPLRDRLKAELGGRVARLDVNRTQKSEGGTGRPGAVDVKRAYTQFSLSIYNLANVQARETVHLRIACVDSEAAYKTVLARVKDAKGRVLTSVLNHRKGDQAAGTIKFEIGSTDADAVLLDVRAVGEVMSLQRTENPDTQNVTRAKLAFQCEILAIDQVPPRETTTIVLAARDVAGAYRALLKAVGEAKGRILVSQLNENDPASVTATFHFEVRREHEAAIAEALTLAGETASRSSSRAQVTRDVIDSKTRLDLTIVDLKSISPRETTTATLAAADVAAAHQALVEAVEKARGWVLLSRLDESDQENVTATLQFDVLAEHDGQIATALDVSGVILSRTASRATGTPAGTIVKNRTQLTVIHRDRIPPRESHKLGVEVSDVKAAVEALRTVATKAGGRVDTTQISRDPSGQDVAVLVVDVPLTAGADVSAQVKSLGILRTATSSRNSKVPEGEFAIARLNVTLSNDVLVPSDSEPLQQIKRGFAFSLRAGSWALMILMVGIFFLLPLSLAAWGGWKLYRRLSRPAAQG